MEPGTLASTRKADPGGEVVSDELLKRWIADCDPREPIESDDSRYVDLDEITINGRMVSLRGDAHIAGLCDAIKLSDGASCQLFSGFSGTGKSTELRRLTKQLENDDYQVLLADAQEYHDLNHALTIEDLIVVIAGAFAEATEKRLGANRGVINENFWQRLQDFVAQDVEVSDLRLPGLGEIKIGIKHAKPFWLKVRDGLAQNPGKLRHFCHDFIRRCVVTLARAEPKSRGVVFVLDSLERLSAPLPAFREVMDSVVRVLTEYAPFIRLPGCHVVYTVPPYAQLVSTGLGLRYDRASLVLPAIKVTERGSAGTPFEPGVKALVKLIGMRIPILEVFGERRDLLERLIVYSGGHVRMLISFVRELLFRSRRHGLPPSDDEIERIVQPFREQFTLTVTRESVPLLARILEQGTLKGIGENEQGFLARFMDCYAVLCCRNGDGWYEVHPLARDLVAGGQGVG